MAFPALLDTCVLLPQYLNDTLLTQADAGTFRPLWSGGILDELGRNLQKVAELSADQVQYRLDCMRRAFPDAEVTGYEALIEGMTNDPKDRHVLAAAVRGNADELARALTNLVGNAIRHTPSGGTVVVTTRRAGDGRIEVGVTDGCGGIPAPDLDRVFDVGWRATPERGTPDDAGAGLGLAIAKGVIEAHAGSIGVENVDGGCRFGVRLPPEPVAAPAGVSER